jgi:hypothetical protein
MKDFATAERKEFLQRMSKLEEERMRIDAAIRADNDAGLKSNWMFQGLHGSDGRVSA